MRCFVNDSNTNTQNFNNDNAKKFYGDGLIYGGEPVLVSTDKAEVKPVVQKANITKIQKYSFLDEAAKVKIYIMLDQFPSKITKEMIDIQFEEFSVNINIVEANGDSHILNIKPLYEKIELDKSSWKYTEKKISITLGKWLETTWTTLTKQK